MKNLTLRSVALAGYLITSIMIILVIWVTEFSGPEDHEPSHIRRTLAAREIEGFELTLTADPLRSEGDAHGAGQGRGTGSGATSTPTPAPQITATLDLTNYPGQDLSDDLKDE